MGNNLISRKEFIRQSSLSLTGLYLLPYTHIASPAELILRAIPSTGERLPAIGMGSWLTFDVESTQDLASRRQVLQAFVEAGGKVVDSSPMYGRSEKVIGQLAQELQITNQLWMATKVWTQGEAAGKSQIDNSITLFKKQPSLLQVHNLVDIQTHLKTLRKMKEERKLKYIGVTHYVDSAHLGLIKILKEEPLDFLQINLSVRSAAAEAELLPLAADKGVAVIINQPFETGALFQAVQGISLPPWAKEWGITTWAAFFLKYIISHPAITFTIPTTRQVKHMQENMAACYGPLPDRQTRKKMAEYIKDKAR